jgi:hypothetical protein
MMDLTNAPHAVRPPGIWEEPLFGFLRAVGGSRSGGVGRFHLHCWILSKRAARTLAATAAFFVGDWKRPWLIRRRMARRDLSDMAALASAE